MDFKAFVEEFQTQVLGIGKTTAANQGRYGAPSVPLHLSFPSNEQANQLFSGAFNKAVGKTCDITVKQEKSADQKPLKCKEVMGKAAQIQLKQSVIDELKADRVEAKQPPTDSDAKVYSFIFAQVRQNAGQWLDEVNAFMALQDGSPVV